MVKAEDEFSKLEGVEEGREGFVGGEGQGWKRGLSETVDFARLRRDEMTGGYSVDDAVAWSGL